MTFRPTACAAAIVWLLIGPAEAQELQQLAKEHARFTAISGVCSMFYAVDKNRVDLLAAGYKTVGNYRFGTRFQAMADREIASQLQAVSANGGAATWCPGQRALLIKEGNPGLIGGNLP